jgi:hypothetical protein
VDAPIKVPTLLSITLLSIKTKVDGHIVSVQYYKWADQKHIYLHCPAQNTAQQIKQALLRCRKKFKDGFFEK